MPGPPPAEVVRLLFEARQAGDLRRVCALLDPEIEAVTTAGTEYRGLDAARAYFTGDEGHNTEVHAHRIEVDSHGDVIVSGRVRIHGRGSLADSPAAWRMTVRDGRVTKIVALTATVARAAA